MGFITSAFKTKMQTLSDPVSDWLAGRLSGGYSNTGVTVTVDKAISVSGVFACVNVLANTVAMVPLITYKKTNAGKDRASDHELYRLLKNQPNPEQTSFAFRHMMQCYAALYEGAYAWIEIDAAGSTIGLWPIAPWRVLTRRAASGAKYFQVSLPTGETKNIPAYQMFEIHWMKLKEDRGIAAIDAARESIGLSLAGEEFGARFYSNGANLGGVVEVPGAMSEEAFNRLGNSVKEFFSGLSNSHKTMLLEEGAKFVKVVSTQEESQYIETRKFQIEEIARFYNIPLHMIGMLDKATFSNIEQQSLEFVKYKMMPWFVNWEQAILSKLVPSWEQSYIFAEFNVEGLLRGDSQARAEYYSKMFNIGVFSQNEIREKENMNAIENGDYHYVPLNMIQIERLLAGQTDNQAVNSQVEKIRAQIIDSYKIVFSDAWGRIQRREEADKEKGLKKHDDYCRKQILPCAQALAAALCAGTGKEYQEQQITNLVDDEISNYINMEGYLLIDSLIGNINELVR